MKIKSNSQIGEVQNLSCFDHKKGLKNLFGTIQKIMFGQGQF